MKARGDFPVSGSAARAVVVGGLCETCNHRPMCMYLRAANRPILECEEYDDFSPGPAPGAVVTLEFRSEPEGPPGLCRNCEARTSCMHLAPGLVFWQCEDYC